MSKIPAAAAPAVAKEEAGPAVAADAGEPVPEAEFVHPFTLENRAVLAKVLKFDTKLIGRTIVVGGWVRSGRLHKDAETGHEFAFIELNDGSCAKGFQVLVRPDVHEDIRGLTSTGTSLLLRGEVVESPAKQQNIELKCTEVLHIGPCPSKGYPIAKTKLTLEYLRSVIHLRTRTQTIAALTRVRNTLAYATHTFFQEQGFLYVNTPIITASDCEGAGEMFQVTTLLSKAEAQMGAEKPTDDDIAQAAAAITDKEEQIVALRAKKEKKKVKRATAELDGLKGALKSKTELKETVGGIAWTADKKIDYSKDFFDKPAFLTVSGQLEAEIYACAMTSVYTFGPTFRAENSNTTRHLAEFWMIEPEIAFCDLEGNMKCAEQYVQFCAQMVLERCRDDMEFLASRYDKECINRLEQVVKSGFKRLSYTEAIDLLIAHIKDGKKKFENNDVYWGIDMGSEHERYLAEEVFKCPVTVYDYPIEIKSFYMRANEDGKTVAAMDVLVPGVGELIGGSQREERCDELQKRIEGKGLDVETYSWYLDLRRYGTVPHSGFGLGFERLVLFATGIENIRDIIPFPRYPRHIL